jgi:hypothetical protein
MAKNHKKTRKPFVEVFFEQVRQHLDFLLTEHNFTGPEQQEISPALGMLFPSVTYHSPSLTVRTYLDLAYASDPSYVGTRLVRDVDANRVTADLDRVYVAAGLGPVQHVGSSARTVQAMARSVASHGAALRQVLPLLLGPHGDSLLRGIPLPPARDRQR